MRARNDAASDSADRCSHGSAVGYCPTPRSTYSRLSCSWNYAADTRCASRARHPLSSHCCFQWTEAILDLGVDPCILLARLKQSNAFLQTCLTRRSSGENCSLWLPSGWRAAQFPFCHPFSGCPWAACQASWAFWGHFSSAAVKDASTFQWLSRYSLALPLKYKECSTLSQAILLKLTSMFAFAGNADIGEHLHGAVWICGSCPVVRRHCGPLRSQAAERYILLSAHFHVRVRPSACSCLAWRMANIKLFVGQSFLICFLYALAHRLCLLVGWHSLHAAVSSAVSIRSSNIKKLLDPIKSGVILLPSSRRLQLGAGSPC